MSECLTPQKNNNMQSITFVFYCVCHTHGINSESQDMKSTEGTAEFAHKISASLFSSVVLMSEIV